MIQLLKHCLYKRKNKMKYIVKSILLIGLLVFSACNLEDINIDPTNPTDVGLNLMLPETLAQTAFNQGTNPARTAGIIVQYYEGFDAQQLAYTDYVLPEITFNNYWRTGLYAGSLRSANLILQKANEEGRPHYAGIAKILLAVGYGNAAAYFGDIPFSESLKGIDNLKPAYDTQEAVYAGVQNLLDEAIADLSGDPSLVPPAGDDLIFGGNASSWVATAQALKARYLMHTVKRNPGNSATIVSLLDGLSFAEPVFAFGTAQTDNNPLAKFGFERPNTIIVAPSFAARLDATADPRKDFLITLNSGGTYYDFFAGGTSNLTWTNNNSPISLISSEEVNFLLAEAKMMTGDEAGAKQAMLDGISVNMSKIGAAGATYMTAAGDAFDAASDKIEAIMNEAYVAYYGQAFHQTYANYRRTGYPALVPSPNGENGLNPGGDIPKRYLYPVSEAQTNSANLDAAKANQSGALMNIPLWAFQ